jgi:hypothetical protein
MTNLAVSTAEYRADPLADVASPAVMARGTYNQNAELQASGISKALPHWERAAQKAELGEGSDPVVVADYGCSQGGNSLLPMELAIRNLRRRITQNRAISVFHVDQPLNDFNCLIEVLTTHPKRYSLKEPNVFTQMIGKSFYEQVLPANSVHLGWSSYAAIWLSRVPALIPDHIFPACVTGEARAPFERQAAEDWKRFLAMRARELRPGGRLVVVLPTSPTGGRETFLGFVNVANDALREMEYDGTITAEERRRMILLSYPRRKEELLAPFTRDRQFHGLRVEECEMERSPTPEWLQYHRDGNVRKLAQAQARFFRAVFTPSLAAGLEKEKQVEFADQLEERTMRRLMAEPTVADASVQTIVLAKTTEK